MEQFFITIGRDHNSKKFEVKDYVHGGDDDTDHPCKFDVFDNGTLVLSLDPDSDFLRVCDNPGKLDEETIHLIIDRVEAHHFVANTVIRRVLMPAIRRTQMASKVLKSTKTPLQ